MFFMPWKVRYEQPRPPFWCRRMSSEGPSVYIRVKFQVTSSGLLDVASLGGADFLAALGTKHLSVAVGYTPVSMGPVSTRLSQ
jgi:hypothetical protein